MIDLTFNDTLCSHIRGNLARFDRQPTAHNGLKAAAVAIVITDLTQTVEREAIHLHPSRSGDAAMILTRRSHMLRHHAGQWALPGGRIETGERAEDTVVRELAEEVGLSLDRDRIIGRLDDYDTRSGFTIKPVVIWGGRDVRLKANPGEVASIHLIPLSEFMREDAPILESIPQSPNPVLMMPVGDAWIAAPTAAIIYQFREVAILGRSRRVAHFEQPFFAWQ
jgi:8-oxo-dGTP pyrophosphatase MutT (NUDIX family)